MQAHPADECRANALHCVEVAQQAHTLDDRSNFLAFAETWYKLANEIDYSDRLVAFIDGLGVRDLRLDTEAEEIESGMRSLRQLRIYKPWLDQAFIDELGVKEPTLENTEAEEIESGIRSLRRLTAAIVAISSSFMADQLAAGRSDASEG